MFQGITFSLATSLYINIEFIIKRDLLNSKFLSDSSRDILWKGKDICILDKSLPFLHKINFDNPGDVMRGISTGKNNSWLEIGIVSFP